MQNKKLNPREIDANVIIPAKQANATKCFSFDALIISVACNISLCQISNTP